MTTYRVGPEGATVFTEAATPLYTLTPGLVVVAGAVDLRGSLAAQHAENEQRRKRVRHYPNKKRPPVDNKSRRGDG